MTTTTNVTQINPTNNNGDTNMNTITSYDLYLKVNEFRLAEGENKVEYYDYKKRVINECDFSPAQEISVLVKLPQGGSNTVKCYNLTNDEAMMVGMRESKAVRKQTVAYIRSLEAVAEVKPLTMEDLLQMTSDALRVKMLECSEKSECTLTPTDLTNYTPFNKAQDVNTALVEKGFCTRRRVGAGYTYRLTEKGMDYGIEGTSGNARITSLRWRESVAELLTA